MYLVAITVEKKDDLRSFSMNHRQTVRVFGNSEFLDTSSEIWYYDYYSTLPESSTVIKPTDDVLAYPNGPGRYIFLEKMYMPDYVNSALVSGGSGNVIFNLTKDGTATGEALFKNVLYVNPIVNNSSANYTYGWSLSTDKKVLTVNVKTNLQQNVLLNLLGGLVPALAPPTNVSNGTSVQILVKGT